MHKLIITILLLLISAIWGFPNLEGDFLNPDEFAEMQKRATTKAPDDGKVKEICLRDIKYVDFYSYCGNQIFR